VPFWTGFLEARARRVSFCGPCSISFMFVGSWAGVFDRPDSTFGLGACRCQNACLRRACLAFARFGRLGASLFFDRPGFSDRPWFAPVSGEGIGAFALNECPLKEDGDHK